MRSLIWPGLSTFILALVMSPLAMRASAAPAPVTADEAAEIAIEAYVYAYPLVLMDASRLAMTNVESADEKAAPVNQFNHKRAFPDASFTDVVRPNADTLYSSLWFDVSQEPLVITVPDSGGRYYLLPMLDAWTDIFASPGKRTTGTGAQVFAIAGPNWKGDLSDGIDLVRAPTSFGWMIGRTQTNGKSDYEAVHKFQAGLKAVPLSSYGKAYTPPKAKVDSSVPKAAPVDVLEKMDAATFFARFIALTKHNPPHANDYPILARMARIGLVPGKPFDLTKASADVKAALEKAVPAGQTRIKSYLQNAGKIANGWKTVESPIGTYATDYVQRSLIAYMGLGANVIEDAIYPSAFVGPDGEPLDSSKKYVLQFPKDQIPPVRAFWSLTMYNERQFFTANPINRFAIGDRDKLKFNDDGSLTLYIQRESPGKDKESNWLPAPAEGGFSMNLRLYWPKAAALEGAWVPPALKGAD